MFVDGIKRADEPITLADALRGTSVVDSGMEPNGVFNVTHDMHLASHTRRCGACVRFEPPWYFGVLEIPCNGIPLASVIVIPNLEFVYVDLEFGGRHDPMRGRAGGIGGMDFGRVRGVLQIEVEVDGAVASRAGGHNLFVIS